MRFWNSLSVLALTVVIALGLPRPNEYKIPLVPASSRTQYYVLHDDGTYKYGYDTGSGLYETAVKMGGNVNGYFGFTDANGKDVRLDYTAGGEEGFVPTFTVDKTPQVYSALPSSQKVPVVKSAAEETHEPRNDASYSFSYETADSHRREEADADLNVKGEFGFVADDGVRRQVNYIAGSGTGFVAEGDHLPKAPEVPGPLEYAAPALAAPAPVPTVRSTVEVVPILYSANNDGSYSFSYKTADSHRREKADADLNVKGEYDFVADDGIRRQVNYIAGSATGFVAEGDHLPKAPEVHSPSKYAAPAVAPAQAPVSTLVTTYAAEDTPATHEVRNDASYSFSYKTDDGHRREEADADLNVKGDYSFVADDGVRRQVNYIAGSDTGFVAKGDHLPKAPDVPSPLEYAAPAVTLASAPAPVVKSTFEAVPMTYNANNDGSYSFSYKTADSHRREEADADLNVQGDYSFVADDGVRRQVNYIAGSETGFVAKGDHLPKAPDVPSPLEYAAPSFALAPAPTPVVKSTFEAVPMTYNANNDGSYSFSYETADSHRKEEADADLNVKGDYSFVADDGVRRQVNYIAGSETGFVAKGDHLPKAPDVPSPLEYAAPSFALAPAPTPVVKSTFEAVPMTYNANNDGSYSFSYETADSHRKEEADADLNVKGDYSFVADDGVRRQVNYIAGSETGFVAKGDHLPKAPDVPSPLKYAAPVFALTPAPAPVVKSTFEAIPITYNANNDGSYSFSYETADSHRREEADANLNVEGEFGFVADDGVRRQVNYIAGSETGFVAEGDHLPKAPDVPSPLEYVAPAPAPPPAPAVAVSHLYSAPADKVQEEVPVLKTADDSAIYKPRNDASYSFSYRTADSHRREEGDVDLNVKGEFGFVADDGVRRQVNYIAGSGTGFVAEGDHLPKAPEVPTSAVTSEPVTTVLKTFASDKVPEVSLKSSGISGKQGYSEAVVSNVLVRQYLPTGSKFGYVFTEI